MKRHALVGFLMFLGLLACGGNNDESNSGSNANSPSEASSSAPEGQPELDVVKAYVAAYNAQDCQAIEAVISPEYMESDNGCEDFNSDQLPVQDPGFLLGEPDPEHPEEAYVVMEVDEGSCSFDLVLVADEWRVDGQSCEGSNQGEDLNLDFN